MPTASRWTSADPGKPTDNAFNGVLSQEAIVKMTLITLMNPDGNATMSP
jgi:hypothetical protein